MCEGCWVDEYDRASEIPENGEEIADLIRELYSMPRCDSGGPLHVAIDDFNIEDEHWKPYVHSDEPDYWTPETMALAEKICERMRPLTVKQRAAVLASWENWI